ncbi:MAG: GNAT family N-acetyltransferase [Chitinophagaceae bacterium]
MIHTNRLQLVPFTSTHYDAIESSDNARLGQLLDIHDLTSWTESEDGIDALPVLIGFFEQLYMDSRLGSCFIILSEDRQLSGTGGYKGAPDDEDLVEIGYEIRKAHQHKGYATEAAMAWINFAGTKDGITGAIAHTLPERNFSVKRLQKCGMRFKGTIDEPDGGEVWRWETHGAFIKKDAA